MISIRRVGLILLLSAVAATLGGQVQAQSAIDTIGLTPMPPDSFYVVRRGSDIVIGWYPPANSVGKVIGSKDWTNWYGEHGTEYGVPVTFVGDYTGMIDRTILFEKFDRETYEIGVAPNLPVRMATTDMFNRTYEKIFNIGANYYNPGDPIEIIMGQLGVDPGEEPDTLRLGFSVCFGEGLVDTSQYGQPAGFIIDVQDFEGYHVWRGLSPYPSEMQAIAEISKEDYFVVSIFEAIEDVPGPWRWLWEYFNTNVEPAWPRVDGLGRMYYEWVDEDAYAGFVYYYNVTTYDRGYFKGFNLYNKRDNFVCDEDPDNPLVPDQPVLCEDVMLEYTMTVDTGSDINRIYAVPNPYRTGTSAEMTPYYHNFSDMTIKFFNMPQEATIKIFTVAGDLVWEGSHSDPSGTDGIISWDVKNKHGQDVGSGVYVFRVENSNGDDMYGRIVVIR